MVPGLVHATHEQLLIYGMLSSQPCEVCGRIIIDHEWVDFDLETGRAVACHPLQHGRGSRDGET